MNKNDKREILEKKIKDAGYYTTEKPPQLYPQNMPEVDTSSLLVDGWRDCTVELPEKQKDILLYTRKGYYTIGYYIGRFVGDGLKNRGDVIAWRPLPDPPAFA